VADAADEEWQTVSKNYADQSHVLGGAHRSNRPLSWHGRQLPRGGDVCAHETEATMRIGGGGGNGGH
jgi:hypothetical protein